MASSAASRRPASDLCAINDLPVDLLCRILTPVHDLRTKLGAHRVCRKWNFVLKRHKCDELWGTVPILRAVCHNSPSQEQSQVAHTIYGMASATCCEFKPYHHRYRSLEFPANSRGRAWTSDHRGPALSRKPLAVLVGSHGNAWQQCHPSPVHSCSERSRDLKAMCLQSY